MMILNGVPTHSIPSPQNQRQRSKYFVQRNHKPITKMMLVGVIIVPILFILLALILPIGQCVINITVTSGDALSTVHYEIYVDGEMKGTGILAAGQSFPWSVVYNIALFPKYKEIIISATSTGGELGTQTDTESLMVSNGNSYNLALTI